MEELGFLVLSNLNMAKEMWAQFNITEIIARIGQIKDQLEAADAEAFQSFLENAPKEVKRRVRLFDEFKEIGFESDDPGMLYLKGLVQEEFEKQRMATFTWGSPVPHLPGIQGLLGTFEMFANIVGSEVTLNEFTIDHPIPYSFPKTPPELFDDLLELNSMWASNAFPVGYFGGEILGELERISALPLSISVDNARCLGQPSFTTEYMETEMYRDFNLGRSAFHLLDKDVYLNSFEKLTEEALQDTIPIITQLGIDETLLDAVIGTVKECLARLKANPEMDLFFVKFSVAAE